MVVINRLSFNTLATSTILVGFAFVTGPGIEAEDCDLPVGDTLAYSRAIDSSYISWREHIIDEEIRVGEPLSGSDGLVVGDLDLDGINDIVSVHESDTRYDGRPDGHVRIAFGSQNPTIWTNRTLAAGTDAAAPEDADIADVNGDGYPDVIVAAELAHLLYLQNPGADKTRTEPWPRLILPQTIGRGSYIRVFFADFNQDGVPEAVTANKGSQNPTAKDYEILTPISIFQVIGDPLSKDGWREIEIGRSSVPQNAQPIDLDGDDDLDVIAGSRGEGRLIFFENGGEIAGDLVFQEHPIRIENASAGGFNLDYADLNEDGRLDIIAATSIGLAWLEQPAVLNSEWAVHIIGSFYPDSITAIVVSDINDDGHLDVMSGSYSRGPRDHDGEDVGRNDPLGRIGWFENPGEADGSWTRHDITRRKRGMFDKFIPWDLNRDGAIDFVGTRGNSVPYDGVFWLEQIRTSEPQPAFTRARTNDSEEMPLPSTDTVAQSACVK